MTKMTRLESTAVYLAAGAFWPLLLFVLCWWSTAALLIYNLLPVAESSIAVAAFTGLAVGIILDVLLLRRWVPRFYTADLRVMILGYLICSVLAVASFMGVPLGNLALGSLAGVYIGRREHHTARGQEAAARAFNKASLFTAAVTGAEAFPIGLLALNEEEVVQWLQTASGMAPQAVAGLPGIGLIVVLCVILMIVQFWLTRTLARIAFGGNAD